jgi:hypothetical protein
MTKRKAIVIARGEIADARSLQKYYEERHRVFTQTNQRGLRLCAKRALLEYRDQADALELLIAKAS